MGVLGAPAFNNDQHHGSHHDYHGANDYYRGSDHHNHRGNHHYYGGPAINFIHNLIDDIRRAIHEHFHVDDYGWATKPSSRCPYCRHRGEFGRRAIDRPFGGL